jgi:hypothetical protein
MSKNVNINKKPFFNERIVKWLVIILTCVWLSAIEFFYGFSHGLFYISGEIFPIRSEPQFATGCLLVVNLLVVFTLVKLKLLNMSVKGWTLLLVVLVFGPGFMLLQYLGFLLTFFLFRW